MLNTAEHKALSLSDTQIVSSSASNLVNRKIWLPKLLYDSVPYFYFLAGITAFLATLYVNEWFWVLPHYLLFSAACVHLGVMVYRRRHRRRRVDLADPVESQKSGE